MSSRLPMLAIACLTAVLSAAAAEPAAPPAASPPAAPSPASPQCEIDRLVLAKLEPLGIRPNLCPDAVFVRRVYLDLTGTLPTAAEARAFIEDPDAATKRRRLIDRLLASPQFDNYWAMKWGDLLRIKAEFPVNLWPNAAQAYHRWVLASVRSNKPYDRFARELLTSSGSNFRVGPVNFYRAIQDKSPEGIATAVALTFMGARAEKWPPETCARMAAFFSQVGYKPTREWKEEIVFWDPHGTNAWDEYNLATNRLATTTPPPPPPKPAPQPAKPKPQPAPAQKPQPPTQPNPPANAPPSPPATTPPNPNPAPKPPPPAPPPPTQPAPNPSVQLITTSPAPPPATAANPPSQPPAKPTDPPAPKPSTQTATPADTPPPQPAPKPAEKPAPKPPPKPAPQPAKPAPQPPAAPPPPPPPPPIKPTPKPPVQAAFPDGTPAQLDPDRDPREVFADWLITPHNRWFTRNIANRAWAWLLGRGIIHEPDDIRDDNPPSNPELLAYLERELAGSGYDLRHLFRLILNSSVYQFAAGVRFDHPAAEANFAAYPIRRLEAEVLIDALNRITGTSDLYTSPIPEPFTYIPEDMPATAIADGSITSPFLALFGRSARASGMANERSNDIQPAHWLHLLNSIHIQTKLEQGPTLKNLLASGRKTPEILDELYLTILSRFPTPDETAGIEAYGKPGAAKRREDWVDIAWALMNSTEFLFRH